MSVRRFVLGTLTAATLASAAGCGSKPAVDASTTEAKVSGSVKIHGKPMTSGEVAFDPANYQRKDAQVRTAKLKPDGTYEVTTLTGLNTISITGPAITKEPELAYAGTTLDVKPGTNSLDIELPPAKQ